ncbi:MAG: glucose 1-dehydrogenase [Alphaproteobacteria bacterium]|nr:glucose 1-dehydrogenase [Alphaproteobacteria bacterium]
MASLVDLSGKVALVTGASRGIGRATAEILATHGANVVLNAVSNPQGLMDAASDLQSRYGVTCWALPADAAKPEAVTQLYKDALKKAGRLDILVANAGVLEDALIGMIAEEQIEHTLSVNVAGMLRHIQMAARLMRRGKGGSVIAMSSIIGRFGNTGQMLYGASKAAVIGMVLSAAKELAPDNIRVNAVAPGFIETDMTAQLPAAKRDQLMANVGMKRAGLPEDVAKAVLFLASDLSAYVTGQVLGVDGGMII